MRVEAEQDGPNHAVLTVKNVSLRRGLLKKYGKHNVRLTRAKLKKMGFPPGSIEDLDKGRPVRFKMKTAGYLALLEAAADVAI